MNGGTLVCLSKAGGSGLAKGRRGSIANALVDPASLEQEIKMLRQLISRLLGEVDEIEAVGERLAALRVILQAYGRLANLLRTHAQLSGREGGGIPEALVEAINEALEELQSEGVGDEKA